MGNTKVEKVRRFDARVQLLDGTTEIEEIFLYGIMAKDMQSANNMAWERAWNILCDDYVTKKAGLRIVDIQEQGVSSGNKAVATTTYKPYTPPKPFKCPIVDLCVKQTQGVKLGTSLSLQEK